MNDFSYLLVTYVVLQISHFPCAVNNCVKRYLNRQYKFEVSFWSFHESLNVSNIGAEAAEMNVGMFGAFGKWTRKQAFTATFISISHNFKFTYIGGL